MMVGDPVCLTSYPECIGTVISIDVYWRRATIQWAKTGLVNMEPFELITILSQLPLKAADTYCNHVWVRYTGITRSYWFCDKCDAKKELQDDVRTGHYS